MPVVSNIPEYFSNLEKNVSKFRADRARFFLGVVLDMKALIEFRIQTRGQNAQELDFDPYSFAYLEEKSKNFPNARNGQVDFTVTGRMWQNIKAFIVEESEERIVIELRADNELDQAKLNSFARSKKNWGNILRLSQEEIDLLRKITLERAQILNT